MIRTLLAIVGIIIAVAILYYVFLSDKGPVANRTTPLNIDLEAIKPPDWVPARDEGLLQINIDGDIEPEWLFFYKDNYNTGQVGGIIYDAQNRPRGDASIPLSDQAPTYLVPYRLMPDYVALKNQGYLGDDQVLYHVAGEQRLSVPTPTPPPNTTPTPMPKDVESGDRLLIRGQFHGVTNRFSVFWWLGPDAGYGGALATTPGWFSLHAEDPANWKLWDENPLQIATLWAWEPQVDRSNICRVVEWRLDPGPNPPATWHFLALYDEGVLRFCSKQIPTEPSFPEGQVLAYLLDNHAERWSMSNPPHYTNVRVYRLSVPTVTNPTAASPLIPVDVDFEADGIMHSMRWLVEMVPPQTIHDPVRWRIAGSQNR